MNPPGSHQNAFDRLYVVTRRASLASAAATAAQSRSAHLKRDPHLRKIDGISVAKDILDRRLSRSAPRFWGHAQQRAMRQGPWKLVLLPNAQPLLANLANDPGAKTNLAASHAERVAAMTRAIAEWEKDVA